MSNFVLHSDYKPTGDQVDAIRQLVAGVEAGEKAQVLLGVTGSGKTFTVANVISRLNRPVLVLSPNKTLAFQLWRELQGFFPENAVEYYVSYYDYYQPESYIPSTDTYIEKDLAINEEVDRLRLKCVGSLLSGRRDVVVVSSVSCIYGMGSPVNLKSGMIDLSVGTAVNQSELLEDLVAAGYVRDDLSGGRGTFRVKGEVVEIYMGFDDVCLRVVIGWDEVERMDLLSNVGELLERPERYRIYPMGLFMNGVRDVGEVVEEIRRDLEIRVGEFEANGEEARAALLRTRVQNDLEMLKELGRCSGMENYSRYFDGRKPGERPFCLLDFFPKDYLMVMDESHVCVPQLHAMWGGDHSRKETLVEYGYRLPAAMDNRPLRFDEFQSMVGDVIYVSATPGDFELEQSGGVVVEQVVRPTGLLDPMVEVRPTANQVDDLMEEIRIRSERDERILVTTLTKRMAEELSAYLTNNGVRCAWIHSDVDTMERVDILDKLRRGEIDVLVGVNLLREGLDLPEVSLVAIFDADKEGFLRSQRSLTQTIGRAARNVNGKAILYADRITDSMRLTMEESNRRREKQLAYNAAHGITPHGVKRVSRQEKEYNMAAESAAPSLVAESATPANVLSPAARAEKIEQLKQRMRSAAESLDFVSAARFRDEILSLEKGL